MGISLSPVSSRARTRERQRGAAIGNEGSSKKECLECWNESLPALTALAGAERAEKHSAGC